MPPPPGVYNASFTVAGTPYGFDVRTNGYGETTEANAVVTAIPWAPTYAVVVQSGGSNPVQRRYRAIVYSEADYLLLRGQRGAIGTLASAREPANAAVLMSCNRADFQDPTSVVGSQSIEVGFTMIT